MRAHDVPPAALPAAAALSAAPCLGCLSSRSDRLFILLAPRAATRTLTQGSAPASPLLTERPPGGRPTTADQIGARRHRQGLRGAQVSCALVPSRRPQGRGLAPAAGAGPGPGIPTPASALR